MPTKTPARRQKKVESARAVNDVSLTRVAYQAVKAEILSNNLRPGEPLPTERLIRDLGLSRTPLREAILQLEKEGFVEVRPRMGTFVSQLNLREIQEMYQVRRTLEGLAARLAAERTSAASVAAVEEELRRHPLSGEVNYKAMSEAGQRLHNFIIESCGSSVLARFICYLQDHFTRFRSLSLDIPEKILSSHREHLRILEALKRGDGESAERLVQEHFDHAQRYLLDSLLRRSNGRESPPIAVGFNR